MLALDTYAPICTRGLLDTAGTRLQHLQLVVDESVPAGQPDQAGESFWRAVRACTGLVALQLVLVLEAPQHTTGLRVSPCQTLKPATCLHEHYHISL